MCRGYEVLVEALLRGVAHRLPHARRKLHGREAHLAQLRSFGALFSQDGRIEFANLQIGFQLAYYRVRLFRLKAGGKGINVDTPRKAGGLLQRPVSHCLRCCSLPPCFEPSLPPPPVCRVYHPRAAHTAGAGSDERN